MYLVALGVAAALVGAAGPQPEGAGPQWQEVAVNDSGRAYVDRRSIRLDRGMVRFVGRVIYARPDAEGVTELRHSGEIDCARREYRIVSFNALDAAGNLRGSHTSDEPGVAINDASPNAALHAEFCP